MKRSSKSRDRRLNLYSWICFLFFSTLSLGVMFHGWKRTTSVSGVATEVQAVTYRASATTINTGAQPFPIYGLRNIEDVCVGDRVFARNPEISDEERATWAEPDWTTWRRVQLEMTKPDGGILRIDMIRPKSWFARNKVHPGVTIFLDLPEMGAQGRANVVSTAKCPRIQEGPGQVVTATFAHPPSSLVLDVLFEDEKNPIGVTENHLFWSVDRQEFVPICEMSISERAATFHGETKRIEQKLSRPQPSAVYNLEVYGEHVYFVGEQSLLAHNNCLLPLDEASIASRFDELADFRHNSPNLPSTLTGNRSVDNVALMIETNTGKFFGENGWIGRSDVSYKNVLKEMKRRGMNPNAVTPTHAEGGAAWKIVMSDSVDRGLGVFARPTVNRGHARVFVDSTFCGNCGNARGMENLLRGLGFDSADAYIRLSNGHIVSGRMY